MRCCGWFASVVAVAMFAVVQPAQAQKRVALVVGNSAYVHTSKLINPKNDAIDMAAALKALGFQVVDGFDLDKVAFDRKVHDFARSLAGADAGVLFYAGHGLQVAGRNYLVPVDAKAEVEALLHLEMVRADDIQRVMEARSKTNVLFLDACRDNPLARNLARSLGTRSTIVGSGLASLEAGYGTLISFSTHPGAVAYDGAGRNSPYTSALVKYIAAEGEDLNSILINVRRDVRRDTQGKQVPWEHSSLEGRFYFASATAAFSTAAEAARVCREVEGMSSLSLLGVLANQHKGTSAGECVAARMDDLKKQQVAVAEPPSQPKPTAPDTSATLAPGTSFRDCPDCPEMLVVPAGSFIMGAPESEVGRQDVEGPSRRVTISRSFAAGKYEVTFAEWDACVADGGCQHKPSDRGWGRGKRPVINVSWDSITSEYLPWLSRKAGKTYRLPTEAEWEFAARAGTTTRYAFGNTISKAQALFSEGGLFKTMAVGSFAANAFGLHDMHGNVWEWVQDCWNASYANVPTDGSAAAAGDCTLRVLRGGSWSDHPNSLRSAKRSKDRAGTLDSSSGFRLARTLVP